VLEAHEVDPRSVRLDIYVCREADRPRHRVSDGRELLGGESLGSFVERLGGWAGTLIDPWGGEHYVSMEPYRDEDPERTFVQYGFRARPADGRRTDRDTRERMVACRFRICRSTRWTTTTRSGVTRTTTAFSRA
jgi:hypothetical protein